MRRQMTLAERLIVAGDFSPKKCGGIAGAKKEFRKLLKDLSSNLFVTLKVNSMLRLMGYELIDEIHQAGLRCFADLKFFDIPQTLENDAEMLNCFQPELVTVACHSLSSMIKLRESLSYKTEILAITTLTSEEKAGGFEKVIHLSATSNLDGFILAGTELSAFREKCGDRFSLNVPGIRPSWCEVSEDDQERISTPKNAMLAGADRIIVGRPITRAKSPRDAVLKILEEIFEAKKK